MLTIKQKEQSAKPKDNAVETALTFTAKASAGRLKEELTLIIGVCYGSQNIEKERARNGCSKD